MYGFLDDLSSTIYHMRLCFCWLILRISMIGTVYTLVLASSVVYLRLEAGLAGFILAIGLQFSSAVFWSLFHLQEMEIKMNSAERVLEYAELVTEDQGGDEPPAAWPTQGRIEVKDLVVGYNWDLPPVLKGISFSVNKNERYAPFPSVS